MSIEDDVNRLFDGPDGLEEDYEDWQSLKDADSVHRGQLRMAYRFAIAHEGKLMHVEHVGWYRFLHGRWQIDHSRRRNRALTATTKAAYGELVKLKGDEQKALFADARQAHSANGQKGVLELAASMINMATVVDDLDADPYLLNCANGTLDLRTGVLHKHNAADKITKITRANYQPGIEGTHWQLFLKRVLPDAEVRAFLQRVVGVALLGKIVEHMLPILTGTGANGKGTFYGAVNWALGDYAGIAEPELFMHREGAHPTGEMDLLGKRWVVVSETEKERRLAEATMKRLTGGDRMKARHMRQDFVEFEPSHTAALITNHLPKVSGDDESVWRRLRVIPFDVVIPEDERDGDLDVKLHDDADAILSWAVDGYQAYQAQGLNPPTAVVKATDKYQEESDAVRRFIDECCVINNQVSLKTTVGYARWESWAIVDGAAAMSMKKFGQSLTRLGYPVDYSNEQKLRIGIGLKPASEDRSEPR